ncbi:MAG: 23S rRNA (pseudouridine(1915)-N(3))-methyltransferase RlmH [Helcococcus sp.]|nr:23S rRNA (pseudouridine(1915)-N(3))-methyltransferase RlmH [Helcococcus sp.]
MNIDIICVGSIKEKYYIDAIKEYSKRLISYTDINIIEVDEYKLPNNPSNAQINDGLEKEREIIESKIKDRSYIIALAIEGKQISSEDLSKKIQDITIEGYSNITFLIGSSYGMSQKLKNRANLKLSFSKMTFPHQLIRVVLTEQIYRAFKIMRNEPYHK